MNTIASLGLTQTNLVEDNTPQGKRKVPKRQGRNAGMIPSPEQSYERKQSSSQRKSRRITPSSKSIDTVAASRRSSIRGTKPGLRPSITRTLRQDQDQNFNGTLDNQLPEHGILQPGTPYNPQSPERGALPVRQRTPRLRMLRICRGFLPSIGRPYKCGIS